MAEKFVKPLWMLFTAITLSSLLWLSAQTVPSDQAEYYADSDFYAASQEPSESLAVVLSISTALKFQHAQQFSNWQFIELVKDLLPVLSSDAYLMTEPIAEPWFLFPSTCQFRLSGWKDASLQYKIKNAFI